MITYRMNDELCSEQEAREYLISLKNGIYKNQELIRNTIELAWLRHTNFERAREDLFLLSNGVVNIQQE